MFLSMSINFSSFADIPLLPHELTYSNNSTHPVMNTCFRSKDILVIYSAYSSAIILLLPFFILILYLGFQQSRQQCSTSKVASSLSDVFLFHSIAMQLIFFLGVMLFFCGDYIYLLNMKTVGEGLMRLTAFGQALLHLLICLERYLAVTKPITYWGLRQGNRTRIRNISIGCVWFLCLVKLIVYYLGSYDLNSILFFCISGFIIIAISFCSISVLCTLKHPGPGEVGGNRVRVDQSKQRAFYTILVISGVLLIRLGCYVTATVVYTSAVLSPTNACVVMFSLLVFDLLSSVVLPLLFLQRAEKLQCCKQSTEAG